MSYWDTVYSATHWKWIFWAILWCNMHLQNMQPQPNNTIAEYHQYHTHSFNVPECSLAPVVEAVVFVCGAEVGECVSHLQAGPSTVILVNTKSFLQHKLTLLSLAQVPILKTRIHFDHLSQNQPSIPMQHSYPLKNFLVIYYYIPVSCSKHPSYL